MRFIADHHIPLYFLDYRMKTCRFIIDNQIPVFVGFQRFLTLFTWATDHYSLFTRPFLNLFVPDPLYGVRAHNKGSPGLLTFAGHNRLQGLAKSRVIAQNGPLRLNEEINSCLLIIAQRSVRVPQHLFTLYQTLPYFGLSS